MKTFEFTIGDRKLSSVLMNAEDQWRLARRAEPMLPAIDNASSAVFSRGAMTIDRLLSSFQPMTSMSDDDSEALITLCVSACMVYEPPPAAELPHLRPAGQWVPLSRSDFYLTELLQIMAHVVLHNLGPLYAMERPKFTREGGNDVFYPPVRMPDGTDWLYRPALRGMVDAARVWNGDLRIEHIAKLNDLIDVAEENERRAIKKAAEKNNA